MESRVSQLLWQAEACFATFEREGTRSYIDEAVNLGNEAVDLCPPDHRERAIASSSLAIYLHARYQRFKPEGTKDLDEAIVLDREALCLRPKGHPDRSESLNNLAVDLSTRYAQLGAMEDLDEAIILAREALDLRPEGHPDHSQSLNNLGSDLSTRYEQLGAMQDLDEAIVLHRVVLGLRPEGHPDRSQSLNNLAVDLWTRYEQLGVMQDLDEAIVLDREALGLRPKGHPDRSESLNNLAIRLSTRYKQLGAMQDLEEAIVLDREALGLRPKEHPDRSESLNNLAVDLSTRYEQLGLTQDLEEAIVLNREALGLRPNGHPDHCWSLNNLAADLSTRYKQLAGDMQDLDEAIVLDREALSLLPEGRPDRSRSLNNLAVVLSTRYEQLGAMQDLDEAIVLHRDALGLRPQGHPNHSQSLNNLAIDLWSRYEHLGAMQDLDEAIVLDREALDLRPKGHSQRSSSLNNLANRLSTRYKQLGAMQDLDEAIVLDREALSLRPKGHPVRSQSLNNLADDLSTRYKQFGAMQDLDEAIVLHREALGLRPTGHADRSESLDNLAVNLSTRYEQLGVMQDLDEAIVLDREALDLRPEGHPYRSESLDHLALHLHTRFRRSGNLQDKEELFNVYAHLALVSHLVFSSYIPVARTWIGVAEQFQHPTLLLAYETALRLLIQHLATLPSLPRHHDVLKKLTSSLAVDAFSACLRSDAPARAVEFLEQGRSVFWTQLTRLHSPLYIVMESGPAGKTLGDKFTQLALDIRSTLNTPGPDQHERLWQLNLKLQEVVTSIRALPGLSRFLLPTLFSDLQCAACGGPVIIVNASKYSCDALIVFIEQDPVHIPLQITQYGVRDLSTELRTLTKRTKREDMKRELACFLRKVWDQIVAPIVDFLRTTLPSGSRVWWCPTAEFSLLPLHAAGPFRTGQRKLADLYISSYTPTLTSLIRARQSNPSTSTAQWKRFLAIGEATATGENELLAVGTELNNVGQLVDGLATFTRIEGEESCIPRVIEELGKSEWVHLACHGIPDRKQPFESAFALHDGRFTIQRIIGCEMQNPEFAYLSACHTTVGDEESPDEVIHLAAAMQFLGFRSVIGTMWAVDDAETNKITSTFYKHMVDESGRLDHTRAALALNRTMRSVDVPFDQRILYIHIGA
ncbi:CHAT domain containing protein [Tylopilus felleus]